MEWRVGCDKLRVHWCFGMGLHWRGARDQWSGCWTRLLVSVCHSYFGRSLAIFHRVTKGKCQGATIPAGLPLHFSSRSNGGGGGVNSCQRFLRVHNFDCVWRLNPTVGKCFTNCALDVCERASAGSARCDECLSTGVYEFSSPAVKPGHGFTKSSLTLEFGYLVVGICGIVVHSRLLVDNPRGSACGGHDFNFGFGALNATGLDVEAPIGSTITLHVQGSKSISLKVCSALHLVWSLHLYLRHAGHYGGTCYHDLHQASLLLICKLTPFVRLLPCSAAAVTFESEPLDGCPSWDLTARRLHATTSTKAQVKIFLESSDETGRVVETSLLGVFRIFQCLCWSWSRLETWNTRPLRHSWSRPSAT